MVALKINIGLLTLASAGYHGHSETLTSQVPNKTGTPNKKSTDTSLTKDQELGAEHQNCKCIEVGRKTPVLSHNLRHKIGEVTEDLIETKLPN